MTQKLLPMTDGRETQAERLRRILSGDLAQYVAPASTMTFTEPAAKRAAQIAKAER